MSRFPVSQPRTLRQPQVGGVLASVLAIGDTHFDPPSNPWAGRNALVSRDLATMQGRMLLDAVVQVGDHTTDALAEEFDLYLTWRNALPLPAGVVYGEIPGNHDLIGNFASGTPDVCTPTQWAALMGQPAKDRVIDVGTEVRLLLVSPAHTHLSDRAKVRRLTLDPSTLAWCKARMAETTRRCVIFFHAPLPNTVGPLDGSAFSSYDERWHAHWDTPSTIEAMIAASPNVVAWVSGHTHSRVTETDIVKQVTYGSTTFAAVNASSPAFWNPGSAADPVVSCYLQLTETQVVVRYRNHGTGQWMAPVHSVIVS